MSLGDSRAKKKKRDRGEVLRSWVKKASYCLCRPEASAKLPRSPEQRFFFSL